MGEEDKLVLLPQGEGQIGTYLKRRTVKDGTEWINLCCHIAWGDNISWTLTINITLKIKSNLMNVYAGVKNSMTGR